MARVLYCHCAYARVVPLETKTAVLERLARSGTDFEAVPDLCEMAARADGRLRELAAGPPLRVAACYPRAVKWLFASAGVNAPDLPGVIMNMRTETPERVVEGLLADDESGATTSAPAEDR